MRVPGYDEITHLNQNLIQTEGVEITGCTFFSVWKIHFLVYSRTLFKILVISLYVNNCAQMVFRVSKSSEFEMIQV